ncbi:MAG: hypothetical protein L0Y36_06875 [Planctomycetales bacterium]|nr:hypothetical protein [Planctomycetales bacterium]
MSPDSSERGGRKGIAGLSYKATVIAVAVAVQVVILVLGIWIGAIFSRDSDAHEQAVAVKDSAVPAVRDIEDISKLPAVPEPARIPVVEVPKKEPVLIHKPTEEPREESPRLKPQKGTNSVVIQGISAERKNELKPIQEYFSKKGIETEIIESMGYALLVTKTLFVQDPNTEGTEGNRMKKRIQELGLLYPTETGDTNFGLKPFQDAYGLKR